MRRANAILTAMILLLFLIHMLWGVLILCGWKAGGSMVFSCLGGVMLLLILFHVLITPDRECMYVDLTEAPFDIKQWPQIKRCMDDLYALWKEYKELKQSENQHN